MIVLVVLGSRHRSLRRTFLEHRRDDMRLQARDYLPAFTAASITNDTLRVGAPRETERQVLLLLTASCPYSRETLPHWKWLDELLTRNPGE